MKYVSTRGGLEPVGFSEAVMMGLAPDKGLLLPEEIPRVGDRLASWNDLPYADLALEIIGLYADLRESDLRDIIARSYTTFSHRQVVPVESFGDIHIAELFHGPTLAFKDIALQFLGRLFEFLLSRRGGELNMIAATSGDTGSAAIYGVRGRSGMRIFVLHPKGRISETQRRQMTSVLDRNVYNVAIEGTFDDCQDVIKQLFADLSFKQRLSVGAVNSINWARVVAQIVYYFYAAFRVMARTGAKQVRFAVPTGNFGDILAGYLAVRMGLPVSALVLATNENDILARFFNTGVYAKGGVTGTVSPSMDIQVASNFERYLYYYLDEDTDRVAELMREFADTGCLSVVKHGQPPVDPLFLAGSGNTESTFTTMRRVYREHGYLVDPHTAVGIDVATRFLDKEEPMICLATAHPAKFGESVLQAIGKDVASHPFIDGLKGLPTRCEVLPASVDVVREYIETEVSRVREEL